MNMTKHANSPHSVRDQRLKIDRRHFGLIFAAAFPFYLAVYGLVRLMPASWRSSHFSFELNSGVVEQAKAQASLIASYATMI